MHNKSKKILLIALPVITIIIIVCAVLLILYLNTDFLKSDETLFLKYMSQNADTIKALIDNTGEKEYTNLLRQNKYESKSELTAKYTENMGTSQENNKNDINKMKITIDSQSEYLNNYSYKNIKLTHDDKTLLTAEYLHDGQIYGIRFPEEFNQFLALENHDIEQTVTQAGMSQEEAGLIPEGIEDFDINNVLTFSDEEISTLQSKYLAIISENVPKDSFSKQKDAMITLGGNSINTNAYSITLTQEQANEIYIKMLEKLKTEEIILNKISQIEPYIRIYDFIKDGNGIPNSNYLQEFYEERIQDRIENIQKNNIGTTQVKYTVYEHNGTTVRTQILEETNQTTIDLNMKDDGIEIDIESETANELQENKNSIQIQKKHNNTESSFSIQKETVIGDEKSTIDIYRTINLDSSNPKTETGISYNDGKNNLLELEFKEDVNLNQQFNRNIETNESNTVIINNYEGHRTSAWTNQVKTYVEKKIQENQTTINNLRQVTLLRSIFRRS